MADRVKVLVVDDEEVILQSVKKVLKPDEEHEFEVDTAFSAEEGLALMRRSQYEVIVTDLMMPGIDGLQFIDRIRQIDRDARIIMITGYATMRTALQALRKGAFDYIAKPFTKEELRSVVKNAASLEAASAARAPGEVVAGEGDDCRSFFNQTYARILSDGTVYFGVEPAFLATIGEPLSIELSKVGDHLSQGFPFGAVTNANMRVFNLRAPFSGKVIEVNQQALADLNLLRDRPRSDGWLLRVEPSDFNNESENLG